MLYNPNWQSTTIIQKAIDILNKYGWIQGDTGDYQRGFCLIGALRAGGNKSHDVFVRIADLLDVTNLGAWNDAPGRSKQDVIDVLEKCK